jgi:tRNA modification GTPase
VKTPPPQDSLALSIFMGENTIFAAATPIGESSVTVIRVSGKNAIPILDRIFSTSSKRIGQLIGGTSNRSTAQRFDPNRAYHGYVLDGEELIDEVVATVFKTPNSYTGEDVVEISSHGGALVYRRIAGLLVKHGAAHAEPGEFSKRAFLNGKMDLAQAEAVADLIRARNHLATKAAITQLKGELSRKINSIRQELIDYCSLIELELDFSEEGIEIVKKHELLGKIDNIMQSMEKLIQGYTSGRMIRNGLNLAITGAPNVGKSTIFNYLLNESRAIVSQIPGTTRDYLEEPLLMGGYSFNLIDTAGIRAARDIIEQEGVRRSRSKIAQADIVVNVIDLTVDSGKNFHQNGKAINVFNKLDIASSAPSNELCVSAKTGENMDKLQALVVEKASELVGMQESGEVIVTSERHKTCLSRACEFLANARALIIGEKGNELISLEVRDAMEALGEIIGKTTNDDILNNIFARFCIGK